MSQLSNHSESVATGPVPKRVALVAHDNRKKDLLEWVQWNADVLLGHRLICTGTTGKIVEGALLRRLEELSRPTDLLRLTRLKSGPLGGDQQLGALITEGQIDVVVFFWDPLEPQPHDVDVKALLRIAVVYNVPIACNRATADFLISSPLLEQEYRPKPPDFEFYLARALP